MYFSMVIPHGGKKLLSGGVFMVQAIGTGSLKNSPSWVFLDDDLEALLQAFDLGSGLSGF